jgi:3-hydroxybutyryl-CoA dehydrogenase
MKIGIIGGGSMGSGIAQVAATAGCEVKIYDADAFAIKRALQNIAKSLSKLVEKGKYTEGVANDIMSRLKSAERLSSLGNSDLIIEAIIEDLTIKKSIFAEVEMDVSDACILATNTSSLSVTSIAAACRKPERVVGIHFFNPATLMPLVEIVPALQTDPSVLKLSKSIVDSWKKTTVLAKDTPGFIVNRIARPFYGEALRIFDEGIADMPTIDRSLKEIGGFRMGAFELMDFIGHDVNYAVTESVWRALFFDNRYKPSLTQKRLVEAGFLGRKSGRGFYNYENTPPSRSNRDFVPQQYKSDFDAVLGQKIVNRIVTMLINEAADALFWQIATRDDIDLAMTKGVNYPKGLLKWADELGIENVIKTLDGLYDIYREDRYRCSPLLRRMADENTNFY